jgi:hypothetical protein
MHLVGYFCETYHDARSREHEVTARYFMYSLLHPPEIVFLETGGYSIHFHYCKLVIGIYV